MRVFTPYLEVLSEKGDCNVKRGECVVVLQRAYGTTGHIMHVAGG